MAPAPTEPHQHLRRPCHGVGGKETLADDEEREDGNQGGIGKTGQELGAGQPITGLIDEGHCREEEEKQAERGRSHHLDRPTLQGIADHTQRDQPVSDPYV